MQRQTRLLIDDVLGSFTSWRLWASLDWNDIAKQYRRSFACMDLEADGYENIILRSIVMGRSRREARERIKGIVLEQGQLVFGGEIEACLSHYGG